MINTIKNWFQSRKQKRREEQAALLDEKLKEKQALLEAEAQKKLMRERWHEFRNAENEKWKEKNLQKPKAEIIMDDLVTGLESGEDWDSDEEIEVTLDSVEEDTTPEYKEKLYRLGTRLERVQPDFNLAVEGNIGSGKTTLMTELERLFMYIPFRYEKVSTWKFLSKYYEDPATYAGALQLEILFSSQENLLYSSRITERSTQSAYWCFAEMLRDDGIFREAEFKLYEQVWQAYNDLPTHIFYVDTPPHPCLERIQSRNQDGEAGVPL